MDKIKDVLAAYFNAWNVGFASKNEDEIRSFMSEKFMGYWSHANLDEPMQYDYHYDLNSVLEQYVDAEKSFESISIQERNNGEEIVVFGRETNKINGQSHHAQCMLVWRKEEGRWKLLREYIELEK